MRVYTGGYGQLALYIAALIIVGALIEYGVARLSGSFDDCVLENVRTAGSEMGARAAYQACRRKYPDSAPKITN